MADSPKPAGPERKPGLLLRQIHDAATAWIFLTRVPLPWQPPWDESSLVRAAAWFPLVGAILGAIGAALAWLMLQVWPPMVVAVLTLGLGALLTGAMHEDGLADSFDGLFGGLDRENRLRILKDSRIGTYGAAALIMVLLLKFAALCHIATFLVTPLAGGGNIPFLPLLAVLILTGTCGRFCAVILQAILPYGGNPDRAKSAYTAGLPPSRALAAALWILPATALGWLVWGPASLWAPAMIIPVTAFMYLLLRKKLGGYTGDTLGMAVQLCECAILVVVAAR